MKTVKQILDTKGNTVWTIAPDRSVFDALSLLAEKNIGALAVVDNGRLVGMFTERDYARQIVLQDRRSKETEVRQVMTRKIAVVHPGNTVEECMALVTDMRVRHLPVFDGDNLAGIVSIGDLVKANIADQQFLIEQLENYITS